ncbi:acyl-CoA dehydrogenase family protein [Streptomyces sp. NPDC001787]|uniref:acyl-CoA dehydrogenase family protein n=1 Tax=Streptomyces sp. NPDC001787 TaxID=3154523 RepID=UPI0033291F6E
MSSTHLTPEHELLRDTVRAFAALEVAPRVTAMESAASVERDLTGLLARQGWLGATISPEYGGMGAGHLAKTVIISEISRVSGAMGAALQASMLGAAKIIHFGSARQKETWLPQVAAGSCLPTIAVTEQGAGSHILAIASTGRRYGRSGYVLDGRKVYVGNSHVAGVHGVVVRTGEGDRGLTAFLVEADRPGLTLTPHRPAFGLHGFSFGEITLDNCRIPEANRIGEEGDGHDIAQSSSILYGRPNLAAVALGLHREIVSTTVRFAAERQRYGRPLSSLATVRDKIGLMHAGLLTAELLAHDAVRLLDEGRGDDGMLMNSKLVNVSSAIDAARTAMEIHGAACLEQDHPLGRFMRDALCLYPPAGTGDIQVLRLAQAALGTGGPQWSRRLAHLTHLPAQRDTSGAVREDARRRRPDTDAGFLAHRPSPSE